MIFDGALADVQIGRDVLAGVSGQHEIHDLALSRRETRNVVGRCLSPVRQLGRILGLFERARKLEPLWIDTALSLKGLPNVLDIRPCGLCVGIDLASKPDAVGKRGYEALEAAFHEHDLMLRAVGDSLALSPPLIVSESQIGELFDKVAKVIKQVA